MEVSQAEQQLKKGYFCRYETCRITAYSSSSLLSSDLTCHMHSFWQYTWQ